ncbi:MAG: hypothetical protein MUF58_20915 [Arcicella sp.]|jgi:hypothetical protein|nr:hypothetical protein [Arcicella sp.]
MKTKGVFFLLAILLSFSGLSQKKAIEKKTPPPFPPPPPSLNEPWLFCKYIPKYKASERLKFYPFNKAVYVRIISYKEEVFTDTTNFFRDKILASDKILPDNVMSDLSVQPKVFESYLLNKLDIQSLTNILYNHSFRGRKYEEGTMCYIPRNAIIFYDDRGFAFEWIEICFECSQYKKTSAKVQAGDFCIGKYELLRAFFQKKGIKYGTENTN